MLSTVQRVGQVLELFGVHHPERSLSEVASALGIPKSTAHALLSTLCEIGLLRRNAERRYRLGWRILALSSGLLATTQYRIEARPVMEELVARFGETVHLATLESGRVLYVDKLQGTRAVQVSATGVGLELPAHCSAVGKVLLASRPWREVDEIAAQKGLPALTPNTITDVGRLRAELEEVAQRGFAFDNEEAVPELCCVAAPIRDHNGEVVAAMSLSVPAYRFHRQKADLRRAIVAACAEVSSHLGYLAASPKGGQRWRRTAASR
jgi:DNA-binding IclR family transcriptional regulator